MTAATTIGAAAGATGGWLGLSRVLVDHEVVLPKAIEAGAAAVCGLGAGR
ncbi:MAG: hypothetical protein U0232_17590 [Thermomicrobiales bacterium]